MAGNDFTLFKFRDVYGIFSGVAIITVNDGNSNAIVTARLY